MEITADFDPSAILRHLDTIERQAEELRAALPHEFTEWQEQDMGRRRATSRRIDVERPTANFTRAATVIWPTSRYRVKTRRRVLRRLRKAGQHHRIVLSSRPVLRPALLDRFKDRFRSLLDRSF